MKINKSSFIALSTLLFSNAVLAADVATGSTGGGNKAKANDVLLSREDAAKTGFANFLAVISAWFNNAYYLGLGFAFIAGFFMFIFAWTKLKKEKEKPEEQQETTKFYWFMGIGVALMSVTAIILAMADTLGIGSGIGQGIEGDKLDSNRTGYGIGASGKTSGFTE